MNPAIQTADNQALIIPHFFYDTDIFTELHIYISYQHFFRFAVFNEQCCKSHILRVLQARYYNGTNTLEIKESFDRSISHIQFDLQSVFPDSTGSQYNH